MPIVRLPRNANCGPRRWLGEWPGDLLQRELWNQLPLPRGAARRCVERPLVDLPARLSIPRAEPRNNTPAAIGHPRVATVPAPTTAAIEAHSRNPTVEGLGEVGATVRRRGLAVVLRRGTGDANASS